MNPDASPAVDLGGCDGCSAGCAVACASSNPGATADALRLLIATGAAVALLALVPTVAGGAWLAVAALALGGLGAAISVLAVLALRASPGRGEALARAAYRLLPLAVGGLLFSWAVVAVTVLVR